MNKLYCVYIMTNKKDGVLYTGVTGDLVKRAYEHKNGVYKGFTDKYKLKMLVYYEAYDNPEAAIEREKRIKDWKRQWKVELIEKQNPEWNDLYQSILGQGEIPAFAGMTDGY